MITTTFRFDMSPHPTRGRPARCLCRAISACSALAYGVAHAGVAGELPDAGAFPLAGWLGPGLGLVAFVFLAIVGMRYRGRQKRRQSASRPMAGGLAYSNVEEALRAVDEAWQRSFDALPDYVCILDIDGKIQRANRPMIERFGPIYGNVIGLDYREIYCGTPTPDPQPPCAAVLSGSPAVSVETPLVTMDGWYKVSSYPLSDSQGRLCGAVSVVSDISERKRAQAERDQLQKQLQQAQKMEAIGQLTGGIAHDFNNILASVMGYSELAMEQCANYDAPPKLRGYLQEIYRGGERARDLIAQMLAFSRGSKGEKQVMPLAPLVKEAVKMMRSTIPSSIDLDVEMENASLTVLGDPTMLHQVILNLCINARDALEGKGRINVRLGLAKNVDAICRSCHGAVVGEFVEIAVEDNGSGISPTVMNRIFDPFFTTKETGKGSGMGLSMVHGIVHEHGGHILVRSAPGQGSEFRVLLPIGPSDSVQYVANAARQSLDAPTPHTLPRRVLVVDDEESVANFVGDLLDGYGYSTTVVSSSREALGLFMQDINGFDLVVTDQTMPVLTGVEMAQAMLAQRADLPIILCTGHSDRVDAEYALALGVRAYLTKPFSIAALLHKLDEVLLEQKEVSP